ncbi:competence type IV pilus minor pilin ComGE [Neobacillus pocheonensis]|uniref:competence type IV pilus minor pilin ComGE n=1 Tax=Neobacillus pocheonensis TaxID=363869 RepID=UPI003D2C22A3
MLRKNNGFFLLELLLSLSALLMVCLFLIPLVIEMRDQTRTLEIEKKARQIMFEELQAKLTNNQPLTNYSVNLNNINYKISWTDSIQPKEVCVSVDKEPFHKQTEICGNLE